MFPVISSAAEKVESPSVVIPPVIVTPVFVVISF